MDLWAYEREQWNSGAGTICGVDEAGAGPLAGPVYAAAVILPAELELPGLNDSKKLTERKREALFDRITAQAKAYSIARVEAAEIDEIDILNARMKAMQLAIDGLGIVPDLALIDGNRDHGSLYAVTSGHICIVGGMERALPSRRRPFWPRSAGTAMRRGSWTGCIRNTDLQSIRATAPDSTMSCWMLTAPARLTGKRF